jgi:hypothetical protein
MIVFAASRTSSWVVRGNLHGVFRLQVLGNRQCLPALVGAGQRQPIGVIKLGNARVVVQGQALDRETILGRPALTASFSCSTASGI